MTFNGAVLGKQNLPTVDSAKGVWTISEHAIHRSANSWPRSGLDEGLLIFWRLNDNGSSQLGLSNSYSSNYTLSNINNVALASGRVLGAASFNRNSSQCLEITSATTIFQPSQPYSISVWCNVSTLVNYFTIIGGPQVNIHGDVSGSLSWNNSAASDVAVGGFFTTNTWIHAVFVRNATGNMTVYKNNQQVFSSAATKSYNNVTGLRLGGLSINSGFFYSGLIDAVGIWTRALTAGEVASLFNDGNGLEI